MGVCCEDFRRTAGFLLSTFLLKLLHVITQLKQNTGWAVGRCSIIPSVREKKALNLLLAVLFEIHRISPHLNDKCQIPTEPTPYSL